MNVYTGDLDPEITQFGFACDRGLTLLAKCHVGRCSSHVKGEKVLVTRSLGDEQGAGNPTGRSGKNGVDGIFLGEVGAHQARVRAKDVEFPCHAERAGYRGL